MRKAVHAAVLLERDGELDVVGRVLRGAAGGAGGVIVLTGPLGIGKTALLRALARSHGSAECVVLHASGAPIELDFADGVLRQLLESTPAAAPEEGTGADLLPALLGLAGERVLLVLVDDLHWADEDSLAVLEAFARRAQHLRAVLVVSVRDGDPLASRPAVVSIVAGAAHRLRPLPLTRAGSAALVRARLGRDCDEEFALACHQATGGNPMLLTALALSWRAEGRPPTAAGAAAVRAMRPSYARDRIATCVSGQPEPARALLKALAVLGELSDAAALTGLDRVALLGVTSSLRKLGLLSDNGFAHPAVRDAVEDMMTAAEREELHVRAARLLHGSGRAAEEVAGQLLEITRPQGAWVVHILRAAAAVALRSGARETAVRYLRRALLDTSADGEDRARVLVDLASAVRGLDVQAAARCISYAVPLLREPRDRAAALIRLTPMVMADAPDCVVGMLRQVAAELGDPSGLDPVDRELALRIEARWRYAAATDRGELVQAASRLAGLGPGGATSGAERELRAVLLYTAMVGVGLPASEVAAQAGRLLEQEPASSPVRCSAAPLLVTCLAAANAAGDTAGWLDQAMEVAGSRGDVVEQAVIRSEQALVHLVSGRITEAVRAAAGAAELIGWTWSAMGPSTLVVLAGVVLQLRDPVLTGQALAATGSEPADECLAAVVGLLRASDAAQRGDLPGAAALLVECGTRLDRSGWRNPVLFPWRTSLALLKHRLGDTEDALALAEEERLIAEEWGAASATGRALRVLGVLRGEQGGAALTHRAIEVLEGAGAGLELALALRQCAELSGSEDLWRRCLQVAEDIGVRRIADQARAALGGGAPAPAAVRLTPSERRVALLAVAGQSNQEIAESLAVTLRAVEKHLTNTYRKLGVQRRAELAEALHEIGVALT
ncbi:AAA family ATPase [Crossiella sp. NPDC003009]